MDDLDILRQMVKDSATVPLTEYYGKYKVDLTESKYSVPVFGMPDNAIVIKADAFSAPDTVFKCKRGECKRADFVIIADTGTKKVILCIEMKARKDSTPEIIQQLAGAQCFVAYCREIGQTFWNQPDFLKDYIYRFISIDHISIGKKKTRITSEAGTHDRPERMMKIGWPHHLQFNHLVGG